MTAIFKKLRIYNRKNYVLYVFCNFISLLLITAYSSMITSPTVLAILPEGGDSRKQVYMIFAMACVGCLVFTVYAASLFYRMKSKELGTFMLLGASKKILASALFKEVAFLSALSSLAGAALGLPFAWLIWRLFRILIIDSPEMVLHFDPVCLLLSFLFVLLVIAAAFLLGLLSLRKTNIIDVVNTEHRNEPLHGVKKWFGPVGVLLVLFGAVFGYYAPALYHDLLHVYEPPAWVNLAYAPVFIGMYMFLLHVVVNGLGLFRRKNYKGLIARSMMKFQGRQTVNNMMVITILIAGGLFGAFYIPTLGTGQVVTNQNRAFDYGVHYPVSMEEYLPQTEQISAMAKEAGLDGLKEIHRAELAFLGTSGSTEIPEDNGKYHLEYFEILGGYRYLSESQFASLTGTSCQVSPGQLLAVYPVGKDSSYRMPNDMDLLTNMTTGKSLSVTCSGHIGDAMLGDQGYYVMDDRDYQTITQGLSDDWREEAIFFNVRGEDNYAFARAYFDAFVDGFAKSPEGGRYEVISYYDPIEKLVKNKQGETYWGDTSMMDQISYEKRDANEFRLYWTFMPMSKILESHEYLRTMAVFLMMFTFIALICLAVAMIICYTRSITIAINNRYVFDDLRRLGASPAFLRKEVRRQSSKVFTIPVAAGCIMIYLLYAMIMYANDNALTGDEILGMAYCLAVVLAVAAVIYLIYRFTLRQMMEKLGI